MKTLLVISYAPSPNTLILQTSVIQGANSIDLAQTKVRLLSPFKANAKDVIAADGIILGTPENLGYMSGALKDFFDRCYYDCLEKTQGKPCASFIRAGHDGTGTVKALKTITTGLKWRWAQEPLVLQGKYHSEFENQCFELGAAMACALDQGII